MENSDAGGPGASSSSGGAGSESFDQLQIRILRLAEELGADEHLTIEKIRERVGGENPATQHALNGLMAARRLQAKKTAEGKIVWELCSAQEAQKYKGLTQDHMMVLQEIKQREAKGIFKKELKKATGLPQAQLTRVLKLLESRKLIKAVKTITSKNMNLYVLMDVMPSREHTGGPWYTEQEFDVDFVDRISDWMFGEVRLAQDLSQRGPDGAPRKTSLRALTDKLQNLKVLNVELSIEDLGCVLKKLVYENKLEPKSGQFELDFHDWEWKLSARVRSQNYLAQTPCGVCPVRRDCRVGGVISPETCVYMDPWLAQGSKVEW